jgi:hypothetical protein
MANNNPNKFCASANRILNGMQELTYSEQIKRTLGNTFGQAAFSGITGKIPKIHVDNNVNSGVRRLVQAVNSGNFNIVGKTTNWMSRHVLTAAGIDSSVVPSDPSGKTIYDGGMTSATIIGDALLEGAIDSLDLPPQISGLSALAFLQQNRASQEHDITDPECGISPYARDLIKYAPKHNFMFMVQITFQPDYVNLGLQENAALSKDEEVKFHFLCRSFTRPPIETEYEDVNMYNFRTKIAKKVVLAPLVMKLYDDNKNSTMTFVEKYLKARSPIARKGPNELDLYETRGMDFSKYAATAEQTQSIEPSTLEQLNNSSASLGALLNENRSILRRIDVFHIFEYGSKVNQFTFTNPKIVTLDMSDFDMDDGTTAATIDLTVAYDNMFVSTDAPMQTPDIRSKSQLGEKFMRKFYQ